MANGEGWAILGDVESRRGGRPLEILRATGLDAPILDQDEPRWRGLQCEPIAGIDLRDRFRGALIGGAIGDTMGRAIQASGRHDDWIAEFKEKYSLCPEMGI